MVFGDWYKSSRLAGSLMREAGVTNVNIKVNPAKTSVFFQMLMLKL